VKLLDKIAAWWKQKQRIKKLALDCAKDRHPVLRCLSLIEYALDLDYKGLSHHDLMFHKTGLTCHNLGHYASVLVFLGQQLKEKGVITRGTVGELNEFIGTAPTSIFTFLGGGDQNSAIREFLRSNQFFCGELAKCLDKKSTEATHTLRLVGAYISVLEDTLVVVLKMAQ
jgi:hypothetical protein